MIREVFCSLCRLIAVPLLALSLSTAVAMAGDVPGNGEDAKKGELLIGRMVEAYGGREALLGVRSIYTRGYIKMYRQNMDGWITRHLRHPLMLRVEAGFHVSPETRILNGAKGWTGVGTARRKEADRQEYEGLLFQYGYMDLPFSLTGGERVVTYKGKARAAGAAVDVLQVKAGDGPELTLYLDEKTHLIAKVTGLITTDRTKTEVSVEFSDFRPVNGIKVPFKAESGFGPYRVGVTNFTQVEFNREMEDTLFRP